MYLKRNTSGQIIGVREEQDEEYFELAQESDPEFIRYLKDQVLSKKTHQDSLEETDTELVRVLEDVIEILMDKNIIQFTDLPKAARDKLSKRHHLRRNRKGLDLLDDSEDDDSLRFL